MHIRVKEAQEDLLDAGGRELVFINHLSKFAKLHGSRKFVVQKTTIFFREKHRSVKIRDLLDGILGDFLFNTISVTSGL